MSNVIIAVSGCGGGSQGPRGLYKYFSNHPGFTFHAIDTVKDEIAKNVEQVEEVAQQYIERDIYLMGHSMGGAVVAAAATKLKVKGVILLSSQTDGLHHLRDCNFPVLFYHGEEDEYFPSWQLEGICKGSKGRMVVVEGLNHALSPAKINDVAEDILGEIEAFFFNKSVDAMGSKPQKKRMSVAEPCIIL